MKTIILCADDYGQNEAISQAILTLCEKKRLSATSCMTNMPAWLAQAAQLKPLLQQVDIGLHFNLTQGFFLTHPKRTMPSLPRLIVEAYLRKLDPRLVEAELNAQLDQFQKGLGCMPDYIDGHQHIHQLPVIRDVVITVAKARLGKPFYLRSTVAPAKPTWAVKSLLIQLLGSRALRAACQRNQIPMNTSFSGSYDFAKALDYPMIFPTFLSEITHQGLIMCHPGGPSNDVTDPIVRARATEFAYLASDQFLADCAAYGVQLGRFSYPAEAISAKVSPI